ncbi:hypothetical protein BJ165DRAFT_774068 [Panaeolus papilionaceus]|nr:hypothetical protein BJ165DRAFT_774068 [Panaeolus papilionaceus]
MYAFQSQPLFRSGTNPLILNTYLILCIPRLKSCTSEACICTEDNGRALEQCMNCMYSFATDLQAVRGAAQQALDDFHILCNLSPLSITAVPVNSPPTTSSAPTPSLTPSQVLSTQTPASTSFISDPPSTSPASLSSSSISSTPSSSTSSTDVPSSSTTPNPSSSDSTSAANPTSAGQSGLEQSKQICSLSKKAGLDKRNLDSTSDPSKRKGHHEQLKVALSAIVEYWGALA